MQAQRHSLGRGDAIGSMIAAVAAVVLFSLSMTAVAADGTQVKPGGPTPHQVLDRSAKRSFGALPQIVGEKSRLQLSTAYVKGVDVLVIGADIHDSVCDCR